MESSKIAEFYAGQSVFITGASGYLGKAVLEKLLRSCPNISKIYILLRSKKSQGLDQRLAGILNSPIFNNVRQTNPENLKKIKAIGGDIDLPQLGISLEDANIISENVSIVIHTAASIKFNHPLNIAFNTNYYGTERVLNLCKGLKDLKAFVHVSTAYANCDFSHVREEIITPTLADFNPQKLDSMTEDEIEEITPRILGAKPNTYTCSKSYAEYLLKQKGAGLPICIVRPSIIVAGWKEPQPGFVDSVTGTTGILAAGMNGMITSIVGQNSLIHDIIPLDIVVNLIIASAWDISTRRPAEIPVYNCCSGPTKPITNGKVSKYAMKASEKLGIKRYVFSPKIVWLVRSKRLNFYINWLFNFLPLFVLDGISGLLGKKRRMLKIYNNIVAMADTLSFFVTNEFNFEFKNIPILEERMSPADKSIFYTNLEVLNWPEFFHHYIIGINKWVSKEDAKAASKSRKNGAWLKRLNLRSNSGKLIPISLMVLFPTLSGLVFFFTNQIDH